MNFPIAAPRSALVCALDWGLGHVARTTPLVQALLAAGSRVTLASNGRSAAWWRSEIPDLEVRDLPDYGVRYAPGIWLVPGLLGSLPRIARAIRNEAALVAAWQSRDGFDLVLSDNRYGCHAPGATSIFVTHQLRLPAPRGLGWSEPIGERLVARLTRPFQEIWVPDRKDGIRLSGRLGRPACADLFKPLRYIGPLSRFSEVLPDPAWSGGWDTVALVSGPEPSRTAFESKLRQILSLRSGRHLLVCGRPESSCTGERPAPQGLVEVPHLDTAALAGALNGAREIICRGGYSTLMDLEALGVLDGRCLFVPTPGQTEQEYLARHLASQGKGRTVAESDLV
jgi:hypothetical protein